MTGQRANIADALGALQNAYDDLLARLMCEPSWNALQQLQLRAQSGETSHASPDADMQQRLSAALDAEVPEWRQLEALKAAIAALKATDDGATKADGPAVPKAATAGAGAVQTAGGETPSREASGDLQRGRGPLPAGRTASGDVAKDRPVVPLSEKIVARNRSLTESLGALQKLDPAAQDDRIEKAGRPGAPPELSEDVSAILKKIKSIAPPRKGGPDPRAAVGKAGGTGKSAGGTEPVKRAVQAGLAGGVDSRGPQAAMQPGHLSSAARPLANGGQKEQAAPASSSTLPAGGKVSAEGGVEKVVSLRETLEKVLERPVQTKSTPRPDREAMSERGMHPRVMSEGLLSPPGSAAGPAPTVEVSDEAEVEIVALEAGRDAERDSHAVAGRAAREGMAAAVSRNGASGSGRARDSAFDQDGYAGYHGHVDEAAVDIVPLDGPVVDPADASTAGAPDDKTPSTVVPEKKPPASPDKK